MVRLPLGTLMWRGIRLRCPRCGEGRLFAGYFRMHERCSGCGLKYERAPGYFLGSTYINYAVTAVVVTVGYLSLRYGAGYARQTLLIPLLLVCLGFPLAFFRYARSLWLAMDCWFDRSSFEEDEKPE